MVRQDKPVSITYAAASSPQAPLVDDEDEIEPGDTFIQLIDGVPYIGTESEGTT
jgi:hypothetical protein